MEPHDRDHHEGLGNPTTQPGAEDGEVGRYGLGRRAALVSILGNLLLAGAKLALALLTHSISLLADAVHSASDVVTSGAVWIGLHVARRPPDSEHPWGHGRAETVATLVVAALLGVAGVEFAWESIQRIGEPPAIGESLEGPWLLLAAGFVIATAGAKEWMARYSSRAARQTGNDSLAADAWHHRTDALSSVMVAVALGCAHWGYPVVDAVLGVGVSLIILYAAWHYLSRAGSTLLGRAPESSLVDRAEALARAVHGVQDVHRVQVHDYGRRKAASLHVKVQGGLPLTEAHRVATEVEGVLARDLGVAALVHAEPEDEGSSAASLGRIRSVVQEMLSKHPSIVSFHALTLQPEDHGLEVEFHIRVPPGTSIEGAHRLEHKVTEMLTAALPELHPHIHVEPCSLGCDRCPEACGIHVPED